MSKTDRDLLLFAAKWRDALAVFEEATMGARRGIARRIAHDLCAEVHFAGEIYVPPRPSLLTPTPDALADADGGEDA